MLAHLPLLFTSAFPADTRHIHTSPPLPRPAPAMRTSTRMLLLALAACVCISHAQNSDSIESRQQQQQQRSISDEPIRFNTKSKDVCAMVVSRAGDYTRLRVSCKGPSQGPTPGRSYYCDFQGKPNQCRAYNQNPRHYFTQMMWDMRKLSHACQGPKVYRPQMCKKYPDEAHMSFLSAWPKTSTTTTTTATTTTASTTGTTTSRPSKPSQDQRKAVVPAQAKPIATSRPVKPQPAKPQSGKGGNQPRKVTPKPGKTTLRPTDQSDTKASRLATEYCWKSFHGFCTYFISWFKN